MDSFDIFKKLSVGAKFKKPEKSILKLEVICIHMNTKQPCINILNFNLLLQFFPFEG